MKSTNHIKLGNYKKCEVCGKRRLPGSKLFLARFPLDLNRCWLWVKNVGIEDLAYLPIEKLHALKYICGAHFDQSSFKGHCNRLKPYAIPTLNLIHPPLSNEIMKEFPLKRKHETSAVESVSVNSPNDHNYCNQRDEKEFSTCTSLVVEKTECNDNDMLSLFTAIWHDMKDVTSHGSEILTVNKH